MPREAGLPLPANANRSRKDQKITVYKYSIDARVKIELTINAPALNPLVVTSLPFIPRAGRGGADATRATAASIPAGFFICQQARGKKSVPIDSADLSYFY